ncbi:hypothetical protein E5676_scaffold398G00630 [Cucumis melo var. makuwa]|uniref:Uncharacterized protein n=1 Tax=Cucumis melo var. makuwa TaxID=1194695 RepID=A0A5D3E7L8_CUCMM|nr:hypothetical protein E5676_scaffold398G00630 [Cucumis melo var. makuwa]
MNFCSFGSILRSAQAPPSHWLEKDSGIGWTLNQLFNSGSVGLKKQDVISEVDPLSVDSIEGHNQVSGKGSPTTGPRSEAGNVVVHRGLHVVTRPLVVTCALSGIRSYLLVDPMLGAQYSVVTLMGYVVDWNCMSMDLEVTVRGYHNGVRIGNAYDGLAWTEGTRLICVSFGSTRPICASFGSTRLICASFGSTRLICAFYGTTRLLCRVRAQGGADRREAGRTREGHMDASGFLIASAMYFCQNIWFVILN